jgi:hypothetical protein
MENINLIQKRYQKPLSEFVKETLEKYEEKIDSMILFGSVARGDAKEDSDIDILVVGDVGVEELVDISFSILLKYGKLISVKDMKKDHFNFLVHEEYSFIKNVLGEGVVLYERMGEAFRKGGRKAEVRGYSV